MNWMNLWMNIFGRGEYLGINMGFWVSMSVVALIVILMNIVFWNMKPARKINK